MSTRLIVRGRTAWASRDYWQEERQRLVDARVHRAEKRLAEDLEEHPPEPAQRSPQLPGIPWTCPVDGVTYRKVHKLTAAEGWVTAAIVMGWYGVSHEQVIKWVRRGIIDAAVEEYSPTKRYRVLIPNVCDAESRVLKNAPAPVPAKKPRSKRST